MLRLAVLWMIGAFVILVPSSVAAASTTNNRGFVSASATASHPTSEQGRITGSVPRLVTPEPGPSPRDDGPGQDPTTTSEPAPTTTVKPREPQRTTTTRPGTTLPGEDDDRGPTTTSPSEAPPDDEETDEQPTTSVAAVPRSPGGPSASPRVRDSHIPVGSIGLSLFVLVGVGAASYRLVRRRQTLDDDGEARSPAMTPTATADRSSGPAEDAGDAQARDRPTIDPATADFLVALGEALMDAGSSVGHVETALRTAARVGGAADIGVIVLPTALIVSVPDGEDLITEIGTPGRAPLRFDQSEDVLRLLRDAEAGTVGATEGKRRLAAIRSAPAPYPAGLVVLGNLCTATGVAAILHGTWVEVALAAVLGAAMGVFRLWTRRLNSSYQPFVVLLAATLLSATVFALTRLMGDLLTFPLLISPLIAFLPGGLLTIAVLELATGQIISGASRLAAGALQLVLLAIGLVAGAQLVGVPTPELSSPTQGTVAMYAPWIGIAVYGVGVVWFQGARSSARVWMLLVMYVAYAGQVIGGLFFGSSLSAFFGALAMTPVAVLVARRPTAPSPLVMILPAFWLLVPGALGLTGVTGLFSAGGADAAGILATTVTSMVGVSLGILLGLLLVARDPERPFSETPVVATLQATADRAAPGTQG